jgi:hypothetical protein
MILFHAGLCLKKDESKKLILFCRFPNNIGFIMQGKLTKSVSDAASGKSTVM